MRVGARFAGLVGIATLVLTHNVAVAFQEPAAATSSAAAPKTIWDGVYSEEQAARGARLYADRCSSCHGRQFTGADGPTLIGADFGANYNKQPLFDLYDKIQKTMPQDNPDLNPQQAVDLVAAILQRSEVPAGKTELPTQAAVLKAITFLSTKP